MSSHRLATRYAKSLIQLAEEKGLLSEVYKDIQPPMQFLKAAAI